jgi:P2 family phage contractile tail tube protein
MGALILSTLSNANIYVNGISLLGRAKEIQLPQLKHKMVEHKGLGLAGSPELWAGLDKMESKITWSSLHPEVMPAAFNGITASQLMVRSDYAQYTSGGMVAELPLVALITGTFKESPGGTFKQHEALEPESSLSVTYYMLMLAGIPQIEVDVLANVYNILGQDQLAQFRANLG